MIFHKPVLMLFLIIFCATSTLFADGLGDITAIRIQDNRLILNIYSDEVIIRAVAENVVVINYRPSGIEGSNTLVIGDTNRTYRSATIDTTTNILIYQTDYFRIEIERSPLRFRGYDVSGTLAFAEPSAGGLYANGLNLNINAINFYGLDNRTSGDLTSNAGADIQAGGQGGAGAPFVWTPDGWGMIADSDGGNISISGGRMNYLQGETSNKSDVEIYFLFGKPEEIFKGMTVVSGNPPMPPKFTLGFMNTEWSMDESELRADLQSYLDKDIPIDAYILDFDWMAWGEDNYGEFRWGDKFPSGPGGQLKDDLDSLGIKLMAIRKPRIHTGTVQGNYCETNGFFVNYTTDYFSGKQVGRLDFHQKAVREWYWDSFVNNGNGYETGIIGYWNDEADEYGGNLMFMQMQRGQYEGQRQYNNRRVWSINRNFYLGSQRYSYAMWSGDIHTGFGAMAEQRLFMLTSIALGAPWWGMDIGGFIGTPSPENYFRWIQFGAFVPVFRVHGTFGEEREPWNYGSEAESIAKKYIRLRYELLPYIYTAAQKTHESGKPMVRPLIFEYPNDINVVNKFDEWLFGDDILVHPIVDPGISKVQLYFPEGRWIDFHSGTAIHGSGSYEYGVRREDIPIFIKAGAVLPAAPVGSNVDDPFVKNLLLLKCFGRGNRSTELYEDDGVTYDYEMGDFATTPFSHYRDYEKAILTIGARTGTFTPPQRDYLAEFHFIETPDSIYLDNSRVTQVASDNLRNNSIVGWAYDHSMQGALVRFPDNNAVHEITVYLGIDETAPKVDTVLVSSDSTIWIQFSESVLFGDDDNSAENSDNYTISGNILVLEIESNLAQDAVTLHTSKHQKNVEYSLTIANISDQSNHRNIMETVDFTYSIIKQFTVILQEGTNDYNGSSDSHIAEYFPDNNMGTNDRFEACRYAGTLDNDDKSALVHFDLSGMNNVDTSLVKAELVLTLAEIRNGASAKNIGSYRLLKPWNEGSGVQIDGNYATQGEVTWNSAQHNRMHWDASGGDVITDPSEVVTVYNETEMEYAWNISEFVHFWSKNPDSNFGILLKEPQPVQANGTKAFHSSEYSIVRMRPKLVFTYKDSNSAVYAQFANKNNIPESYRLDQNYPNPFNSYTTISYQLPKSSMVELMVYNVLGQKIQTLVNKHQQADVYQIRFNANNLASGVYVYVLKAGEFLDVKKCLFIK